MSEQRVTMVIDGPPEFGGRIPAEDFIAKLREFVALLYAFDRAHAQSPKRNVALELVQLSKNSPACATFKYRAMHNGYEVSEPAQWSAQQLKVLGQEPSSVDARITDQQLDTVISFAHRRKERVGYVRVLKIKFDAVEVDFDEKMEANALSLRQERLTDRFKAWFAGVSKGSLFGELRSVSDIDGERKFVICPPSGPEQINCIFSENLRAEMQKNLFKVVRVSGFLHYSGNSPHANLMDASSVHGVEESKEHIADCEGLFKDYDYESEGDLWPTS